MMSAHGVGVDPDRLRTKTGAAGFRARRSTSDVVISGG